MLDQHLQRLVRFTQLSSLQRFMQQITDGYLVKYFASCVVRGAGGGGRGFEGLPGGVGRLEALAGGREMAHPAAELYPGLCLLPTSPPPPARHARRPWWSTLPRSTSGRQR